MSTPNDARSSQSADSGDDRHPEAVADRSTKEPSLGPACLVITILSLAVFTAVCAFGSWFMFSDQYPLAVDAISQQLIPWVETSQLAADDKQSIVSQIRAVLPSIVEREISKTQLLRLRNCLQDNPVLLWGGVQSLQTQAPGTGLSTVELQALERVCQRLLRMAAERKLGRKDLEYALQNCSEVRSDQSRIEVMPSLRQEQIQEFMQRAEQLVNQNDIPNESYGKSPAQVFAILIASALDVPE